MGITQLHEAPINWTRDLNGSTSATPYPSLGTDGIPKSPNTGRGASRVHVATDYTCTSGTMSLIVSLYGYTDPSSTWTTSTWVYLGSLNGASSITTNTSTWSQSSTRVTLSEVFSVSCENYQRFATRAIPGGNSPVVSTYIGFPTE